MRHVDLVRNDWANGRQELVARVTDLGGELKIENVAVDRDFTETVQAAIDDLYQHDVAPLQELQRVFANSYFFATAPHTGDTCPFAAGNVLAAITREVRIDA